ncbi:LexA family protein [Deinococcus metallilatus]|uniref:Repressor LexA n=2 Tax=Deinococcus metallilatus TaxID=1211322 RepID=A0ABR6MS00_9DEIO|nr:S24 family peptidase [Deinococcus metallilatus]MBB5294676.1 repressor LexA [Deinococcus metallilatus]
MTTGRLAQNLSLPRQNARVYALALRDRGLVMYDATERHTALIRLTDAGWAMTRAGVPQAGDAERVIAFPIVGEVAAGEPTLAEQHIEGYAARLSDVLDLREGDFLLKVRGDSMIGVGIFPGDLVAIHPSLDEPHSGEIALVVVPGENTATLKRWQRNNGTVTLHSENPAYAPLTYKVSEVRVEGCLVGHIGTGRTRRTHPPHEG